MNRGWIDPVSIQFEELAAYHEHSLILADAGGRQSISFVWGLGPFDLRLLTTIG